MSGFQSCDRLRNVILFRVNESKDFLVRIGDIFPIRLTKILCCLNQRSLILCESLIRIEDQANGLPTEFEDFLWWIKFQHLLCQGCVSWIYIFNDCAQFFRVELENTILKVKYEEPVAGLINFINRNTYIFLFHLKFDLINSI